MASKMTGSADRARQCDGRCATGHSRSGREAPFPRNLEALHDWSSRLGRLPSPKSSAPTTSGASSVTPSRRRSSGGSAVPSAPRRTIEACRPWWWARDGRHSSPELRAALVGGLRERGRDVVDVGRVPTPVLYFAAEHLGTRSGVMVTGSHNPSDYNGLKIVLAGETLHGDAIQDLGRRIESGRFRLRVGAFAGRESWEARRWSEDYIRRICREIPAVSRSRSQKDRHRLRQRRGGRRSHQDCSGSSDTTWWSCIARSTAIFQTTIPTRACPRTCRT